MDGNANNQQEKYVASRKIYDDKYVFMAAVSKSSHYTTEFERIHKIWSSSKRYHHVDSI